MESNPKIVIFKQLSLLVLFLVSQSEAVCNDSLDCSLNGDCVKGVCACDYAWTGAACNKMAILPMNKNSGYHNHTAGASWGGLPIYVDGKWHLFVSQMVNNCSLDYYGTNSEIIRAVSDSPGGPFVYAETVVPVFAHNPTVRITSDGTFLLYMIGNGFSLGEPVNCSKNANNIMQKIQSKPSQKKHGRRSGGGSSDIHIAYSSSVYGPWKIIPVSFTNPHASTVFDCAWTNPSPVVFENDSVLMAFTAGYCHGGIEAIGIAKAPHWKGPYTMETLEPIFPKPTFCLSEQQYEDPFFWRGPRGFHILLHGMCPTGVFNSKYAYSLDGIRWKVSPIDPYVYVVLYEDGSEDIFVRCERPQLLFNDEGEAIYLFTGVKPLLGHEFTIARPLV
jgi:hypothetical protein